MKKTLSSLLALVTLLSCLAGCASDSSVTDNTTVPDTTVKADSTDTTDTTDTTDPTDNIDPTGSTDYTVDPAFASLDCYDFIKECMTAFVNGDTERMESYFPYCEKGVLSSYKTIKFSSYSAEVDEKGYVILTVDVSESGVEAISPGKHVYRVGETTDGVSIRDMGRNYIKKAEGKAFSFVDDWYNSPESIYLIRDVKYYESTVKYSLEDLYKFLYAFALGRMCYANNGFQSELRFKKNDLTSAAEEMFGITDHSIFDDLFATEEDGAVICNDAHGPCGYYYEVIEAEDYSITVQLYSDINYTVKSHIVKHTFRQSDNGDYLIPVSSEIIEHGEYEPERKVH